jgi:hypothetical protein
LEQATPSFKKFTTYTPQNKPVKSEVREKQLPAHTLVELKAGGKCFKCREPWVPGHTKVCKGKQLYFIILIEIAEGNEEVTV